MSSTPEAHTAVNQDPDDYSSLPPSLLTKFVGRFKFLWDRRSNGDCQLTISCSEAACSAARAVRQPDGKVRVVEADQNLRTSTSIRCHSAMLSAGSDYFMKRLQSDGNDFASSSDGGSSEQHLRYIDDRKEGITYLKEQLNDENELPAFEAMIQFFYLLKIDPDLKVPQLLQLLEVSDRYAAMECRAATLHVLLQRLTGDIDVEDLNSVCDFQPTNEEGWQAVKDWVYKHLMSVFGETNEIIHKSLQLRWRMLTWNAVQLVDELEVKYEETVALMLTYWVYNKHGSKKLRDKPEILPRVFADIETKVLRFAFLSPSFFGGYLKEFSQWLTLAVAHQHEIYRMISAPKEVPIEWDPSLPSIWYTPRSRPFRPSNNSCSLEITKITFLDVLKRLQETSEPQKITGTKCFTKGWWLQLILNITCDGAFLSLKMQSSTSLQLAIGMNASIWLSGRLWDDSNRIIKTEAKDDHIAILRCLMKPDEYETPGFWRKTGRSREGKMSIEVKFKSIH